MAENGSDAEGAPVLWQSISQIARSRGVKPQSIHEKVVRLVDSGLLQTRPGRGRERLIDRAQFDRAVGETRERVSVSVRDEPEVSARMPAEGAGLTKARTVTEVYRARLIELEYQEKIGSLVPVADLAMAATEIGHVMLRVYGIPLLRADVLMAAAAKGLGELRAALKAMIHEQRQRTVDEWAKLPAVVAAKRADTDAS